MALATPALFTITCSPPNRSTVTSTSACTWSASVTSVGWNAADLAERGGHLVARVGVDVGDDDTGALGGEALDRRPADAAGAAGDDGDLALELTHRLDPPWPTPAACRAARYPNTIVLAMLAPGPR